MASSVFITGAVVLLVIVVLWIAISWIAGRTGVPDGEDAPDGQRSAGS
jgi:hypothetical protein